MKVRDLIEGSAENIGVLKDMVKAVLKSWPEYIPEDSEYIFGRDPSIDVPEENGNTHELPGIDELIKKYEDYPKIVRGLKNFKNSVIVVDNRKSTMNGNELGVYKWKHVVVYISAIKKNYDAVYDGDIGGWKARATFNKVLAHELRHFFQDDEYSGHMRSGKEFTKDWNQRPMEWDAEWTAIISQYNPRDWSGNVSGFVEDIMYEWLEEVQTRGSQKIPPKVVEKYRKKTIKFYFQHNYDEAKRLLKMIVRNNFRKGNGQEFVNTSFEDYKDLTDYQLTPAQYNAARNFIVKYWKEKQSDKSEINTI